MKTKLFLVTLTTMLIGASALSAALLGEYTFNDTGTGTIPERMAVAMAASSVIPEATFSELLTNTTTRYVFAGFNNLPGGDYDGYGFGDHYGNKVTFLLRAALSYESAYAQSDTSAAVQPYNFTLTTDATHPIVVSNLTITSTGGEGAQTIFAFQEAGEAKGSDFVLGTGTVDVNLNAPVIVAADTSKTFTIHMNSGAYGSKIFLDNIAVNGAVIPEPFTLCLFGFGVFGLMISRRK